ncbi:transposase [Puniceicoccus vermicola]|uniref:Transposase n=1 Tax=Puniceicoccus vermicola TaxID=388746 RepID=A0A7X1AV19_9BACT|nr:transposase [Puniceicoccus vermicola]MBC2600347.1 transposase [Puniceicoccus vermicola]
MSEQDPLSDPSSSEWAFFNPRDEIDIYSGRALPHWGQANVWYFITFRLFDALPESVIEEIHRQREHWRRTHDLDHLSAEDLAEYHHLFSERYEKLLHAGNGSCLLRKRENALIVENAFQHFAGQRYDLDEYVIMPNHVHVLAKPCPGFPLREIVHSWKSYTANQINQQSQRSGQLWQHESYDHIVRNESALQAIRRYIRDNPRQRR